MLQPGRGRKTVERRRRAGFSLLETLVALVVLMGVAAIVMSGMVQAMRSQGTIANRTEMHSSVRSATELLEQEIGQAGKVSLPPAVAPCTATIPVCLTGPVAPLAPLPSPPVTVSSTAGMFNNEYLDIDTGANQETVQVTIAGNTISGVFYNAHAAGALVTVTGSFGTGIVPPAAAPINYPNGSTGNVMKLYGDINGDGRMLYVEYTCDTVGGNLYRNQIPFDAVPPKPGLNPGIVVLNNVLPNPDGSPCFIYQTQTVPDNFVIDVAVTLTVQTQIPDPQTNQFQRETKALLNVSPRNVFEAWELASASHTTRVQPMPPSVTLLLP